ncbi:MAG: 50S ribosomal protein L25 [Candidatus Omnitrophica bacterium]|nr:50S ribosomal protein L25 [Candidatus Omnitrophota bacterium]
MAELLLEAQPREEIGKSKVKDLRGSGFIPAVIYANGKKPMALKVSSHDLIRLIHQHRIEGVIINLKIKGDKGKSQPCLIKEIQYHPVHDHILHVDFNEISLTEVIKVNIPVSAKGEPIGVKQEGGSLEHVLWEIEVECLPTDIPEKIEVDVSLLKIDEGIQVKDLSIPPAVKVLNDPDALVLSVIPPMKEEVPVEPIEGEEVSQEPEVIKEKKEVEAEGEAEGKGQAKEEAKEPKTKEEKK